jgi:tetratricopeptide (TPR) repeat protein
MAFLELKTGNIEKAYKYATKRGDYIWNKRGEKFAIAKSNAFAVLGNIYFEKGEYEKAMYAYKRGLATAKFFNYTKREITILGDIANLYIIMGDYGIAEKKLNIALEKAEKEYFIALPSIYLRKSNICLANREFEKAKEYIDKALEKAKELELVRDIKEAEEALNNYLNLMQD